MFRLMNLPTRALTAMLLSIAFAMPAGHAARSSDAAHSTEMASIDHVLGTWSTQDGHGVIAIEQCGDALCGRIVGIDREPSEPMPTDVHGAPQCGLTIISKERPTGDGSWLGEVTDPRTGKVYGALIWIDQTGNLRLRGFLGLPLLGQTQTWHRFTGHLTSTCGLA